MKVHTRIKVLGRKFQGKKGKRLDRGSFTDGWVGRRGETGSRCWLAPKCKLLALPYTLCGVGKLLLETPVGPEMIKM